MIYLFFDSNYEWQTKTRSNQSSLSFHLIIYAIVTLNVRICIGFNVTIVACDDISSKKSNMLRSKKVFLFIELTGHFHLI
jgi:hypothetical protein